MLTQPTSAHLALDWQHSATSRTFALVPTADLVKTRTPGVFKKGNRYVAIVRVGGKQRKLFAGSLKEARELRAQLQADFSRGEYKPRSAMRFSEYAREWIDSYQGRTTRGFREPTRANYRTSIITKAIPFFDARCKRLSDIEPVDVRAFITWLFDEEAQSRRYAVSTVKGHVAAVRALLATAAEDGVLRHNAAYGVRVSRPGGALPTDRKKTQALAPDELAAVLRAVPDEWRLFFDVLLESGMRIGEAVELRWRDITFGDRPSVSISRNFYLGAVGAPKSDYGFRTVPLSRSAAQRLWRRQGRDDELVFPDPLPTRDVLEGRIDQDRLRKAILAPAVKAASVPWATLHTFRHTCASLLFAGGRNPKQVQAWLGHHDPTFTMHRYVHLLDDGLGEPLVFDPDPGDRATPGATQPTDTGRSAEVADSANRPQSRAVG